MIRAAFAAGACFALLALASPPAVSAEAPRITSATLTPARATVGDRLTLRIEVVHDEGVTIEGPGFDAGYGGFELVEIATPEREARTTALAYVLTSFTVGTAQLEPLTLRWRLDGDTGELTTPPQQVEIASVLLPGETELRPLKPQLDIADPAPSPVWPALYVALFAALTALGYVLFSRATGSRPAPTPAPPRPLTPGERARLALSALQESGAGDVKLYYAGIASAVRRYLSERFGFPAYAMTRTELERDMTRNGVDRWPARLTANLLEQSDAVQFAEFRPPAERADADLNAAFEIVDLTDDPPPDAEAAVEPPPA